MSSLGLVLGIFDDDGIQVDTTTAQIDIDSIEDIIDHAVQLVLEYRNNGTKGLENALAELDEAVTAANLILYNDERL